MILLLAGFASAWDARALVPPNANTRYDTIPQRNVFGLKPQEQPPSASQPPSQLPKVTVTGITTILGNKLALLKTQPSGAKPGQSSEEQSMILTEGQREGPIEVLNIDERTGNVRLDNSGTVMTLNIDKDGPKPPVSTQTRPGPFSNPNAGAALTNSAPPAALPGPPGQAVAPGPGQPGIPRPPNPAALSPTGFGAVPTNSLPPQLETGQGTNLTPEEKALMQQYRSTVPSPPMVPPSRPAGSSSVIVPPAAKPPDTVPPATAPVAPSAPLMPQ